MTQLHAQPYDLSATGFYFETVEDFDAKANTNRNDFGQRVEEYEIQFIDGDAIDCALASSVGINQASFSQYLDAVENLRELAEQFVDEGMFGDIPERLQPYLDHDAIARDLGFDYTETEIAGQRLIYRCGGGNCTRKPLWL